LRIRLRNETVLPSRIRVCGRVRMCLFVYVDQGVSGVGIVCEEMQA